MWLKEIDEKLVPPPAVYVTEDGRTVFNMAADEAIMRACGWRDWTEEEIEEWEREHPQPPPPEQTVFSKLAIRRAMRALGIETKLDAILAGSATFRADWTDAQEIDLADPVLAEALAAGGLTAEEIASIKRIAGGGALCLSTFIQRRSAATC